MKLIKTAEGKTKLHLSKKEWENIGEKQGWNAELKRNAQVEKKERYCEVCDKLVGTMSDKAWEAMEKICDICGEKKDLEEGSGE